MPTKYHQTRDESAAILKRVIVELGQHDAPFDPAAFAVWYEYYAGINPALTRAVEELRQVHPRLSPSGVEELYATYIAEPDAETAHKISSQIDRVMESVVQQAKVTGREAQLYGHQLKDLSLALQSDDTSNSSAALSPHWDVVSTGTDRMRSTVAALAQAVEDGQAEILRLRSALERSRIEAITDPLSLLLNRKGFDNALRAVLSHPAPAGKAHCLIILDIDHFKRVNDTYGHLVGDAVIQTLGQLLQHKIQGLGVTVARIGGEEFAVLMESSSIAQSMLLAQTIQELLRNARIRRRGSQEILGTVTISAGIAAYVKGDDWTTLIDAADSALYRSKQNGRDRITVA